MPIKVRLNYGTIDQAATLVLVVVVGYPKRPPVDLEGYHVRARKHKRGQGLSAFGNTHCRRNSGANSKGVILAPTHNDL
jgi:hypothetical protein